MIPSVRLTLAMFHQLSSLVISGTLLLVVGFSLTFCAPALGKAHVSQEKKKVLILYDKSGETPWLGHLHSTLLANLLGHFDVTHQLMPIDDYTEGLIDAHDVTFYLGSYYDNPLPSAFLKDATLSSHTLIWFRYNLWQLAQFDTTFTAHYGFHFVKIARQTATDIRYKNTILSKNALDPELGEIQIETPSQARVLASACEKDSETCLPYIVQSGHLWYVADIPLTYLSENDRYLAFADLLYDILGVPGTEKKRALVRIEDVSPLANTQMLRAIADYLHSESIPFIVSTIPYYRDPLGRYNNGKPQFVKMTEVPDFVDTLHYLQAKGGTIILHGYTHQYGDVANAFTGASADDYEFFRVMMNPVTHKQTVFEPIAEETLAWIEERVQAALTLLHAAGLATQFWETPHYAASALANQYFATTFNAVLGRILYFDPEDPRHSAGQFFPYVINRDTYGQKIIPENLGCIQPSPQIERTARTPRDLVLTAEKNLVVRDAWAAFYFHPFLGLTYLEEVIEGLKDLGYEFVALTPDLA